ncbi:MAG: outer membrane lipoprotein carrier protein LolA [Ramlibacter sp.]|nr:outer membrane lipoprotein carrier protein LolA [Ramlibacter sp.]
MIRIFALAASLLAAPAWAAWDIDELMQTLAKSKASKATFVEHKHIAMLDAPVVSSGELVFTAPDRLERRTLKPRPESVVLEGDTMTLRRGERQMVLKLQDYPAVGALIESIRATLGGDRAALQRHYNLKLDGTAARWSLTLSPREARTRALVLEIRIDGELGEVRTVEIEQADKDRSVMTIRKAGPP